MANVTFFFFYKFSLTQYKCIYLCYVSPGEKKKKGQVCDKKIENNEKLVRLGRKIYQVVALESMQDRGRLQSNSRSVYIL